MILSSRPATPADAAFARATHHSAYHDVVLRQFGQWEDAMQDRLFEKTWQTSRFEILLCNGVPCGYAGVDHHPDHIHVRELVFQPGYQGSGLGTQFLRRLFDSAITKSIPIRLQVLKANHARELYTRLGFRETGTTATHVLMEWQRPGEL